MGYPLRVDCMELLLEAVRTSHLYYLLWEVVNVVVSWQ